MITLLDYGAGNVRSVVNAIEKSGEQVKTVASADDILTAEKLVFPGVGNFGSMIHILNEKGYIEPLKAYLASDRPFLGICLGLQALFYGSEEAPGVPGLGIIPGTVRRFDIDLSVPHIGWNGLSVKQPSRLFEGLKGNEKVYFVHSYYIPLSAETVAVTEYDVRFSAAVQKGNLAGVQFHPEKSQTSGFNLLKRWTSYRP